MLDVDKQAEFEDPFTGVAYVTPQPNTNYLNQSKTRGHIMRIFIDIETIPTQNADYQNYVCENLKAPGNYKNAEAIEKWLKKTKAKQ